MIKQNIKMRVTPEQSKKVQEICFANGIYWIVGRNIIQYEEQNYLYLSDEYITFGDTYEYFEEHDAKEIDADLFIRTNGTCKDTTLSDDNIDYQGTETELLLSKMIDFKDEEYIKLEKKVFNLKKQLEKHAVKIGNQKEEITRLLAQKEDLQNRLNTANRTVGISINIGDDLVKELDEKYTIIKYLENKLDI